ncbi:MAG: argininosuccinate synthase [Microthrixaceae bacterium]
MAKRVVLAYSGGLDTSVAVRWMIENMGVEVVCLSADVGQEGTLEGNREKALGAGAIAYEELDLREEFARDFLAPVIRAERALRGPVPARLGTQQAPDRQAPGRAGTQVRCGRPRSRLHWQGERPGAIRGVLDGPGSRARAAGPGAQLGVHPRGLDRLCGRALDPRGGDAREALFDRRQPVGRAIECGEMEDPWAVPPEGVWQMTVPTRSEGRDVVLGFESGVPVSVDGERMPLHELIVDLNHTVGSYGWGRLDMVENRRVGIKSRRPTRPPGRSRSCSPTATWSRSPSSATSSARRSAWSTATPSSSTTGSGSPPLKEALDSFVETSQEPVTGEVRLRLEPGRCFVTGRRAPKSLYDYGLATYDAADRFNHADSGFVRLWGLGVQTWSGIQGPGSR